MNSTQKAMLRSRLRGSLLGVITGDAMGGPVECMKDPEEICRLLGGPVTGFLDPREFRTDDVPEDAGPGTPSDDWQQTYDVGMSIIECKGFNLEHSIKRQIDSWKKSPYGAGGTTRDSFTEMDAWFRSGGKEGRSPHTPPPFVKNKGAGNGPAMKVVPLGYWLGYWHALKDDQPDLEASLLGEPGYARLRRDVTALGRATHGDPRASFAAIMVAGMHAVLAEGWLYGQILQRDPYRAMLSSMSLAEHVGPPSGEGEFWKFLKPLLPAAKEATLQSADALRQAVGTSSLCWESIPFSIGVFLRHPKDFRAGILEAVNAGGDTDTNASIAGGLIGAEVGENGIPAEWRTFHPRFEEAISLADALTDLIADQSP